MGLDTYASRSPDDIVLTEEDEAVFGAAHIELCGGIASGDDGSFRGKVYADLVLEVTEESLYREWIPPETVKRMAEALAKRTPAELVTIQDGPGAGVPTSEEQLADLQRFFAICAERGLGLIGWY